MPGHRGQLIDQFKMPGRQVILFPPPLKSGKFEYLIAEIRR
jgi:hypothetical protein